MYRRISAIVPTRILAAFRRELDYMNIEIGERRFVGFLLAYGIALSAAVAANLYFILGVNPLISGTGCFVLFFAGVYFWLSIAAESKGKFVEKILPDALQLIASNMKAGLTMERALIISAREEFGPLEAELKKASKRVIAGDSIDEALAEIPKRIHLRALERTIELLRQGLRAGGQMADLLTQLSDDLRSQLTVQDEIKANISIYVMLIVFAALFGAPVLFGVSTFIAQALSERMSEMPEMPSSASISGGMLAGRSGGATGLIGKTQITPDFVLMFAEITLALTIFFASLTIGVINSGSEKAGLKIMPVLLVIVFVAFFAIRQLLMTAFAQLI